MAGEPASHARTKKHRGVHDSGAGLKLILIVVVGMTIADLTVGLLIGPKSSSFDIQILHAALVGIAAGLAFTAASGRLGLIRITKRARDMESAVNASPHALFLTDTSGKLTYASEAWLQFTGRSFRQELRGSRSELVHPDDLESWSLFFQGAMEDRVAGEGKYRMRRHDGEYRILRSVAVPRFENGEFVGLAGMCEDVTDAEHTQSELHMLGELVQSIVRSTPTVEFAIDELGVFTRSHGAGLSSLGLADHELVGTNIFDSFPAISRQIQSAIDGSPCAFTFLSEGDPVVTYQVVMVPNPSGGASGFALDVTQQIAIANQRATLSARLETLLAAGSRVQAAQSVPEIIDAVAEALHRSGWGAVMVWTYDDEFRITDSAHRGVSQEDIETLLSRPQRASERERMFGRDFDAYKLGDSYFVPAGQEQGMIVALDGAEYPAAPDSPDWHDLDCAYIPLRGQDGRIRGRVDIDCPADGKRPTLEVFDYLESFTSIAAIAIERLESLKRESTLGAENKLLLETLPVVVWNYSRKIDRFTYVTPQAGPILGYEPDAWTDFEAWREMIHPEDRERIASLSLRETEQGRDHELVYRFLKPNGEVLWVRELVSVETVGTGEEAYTLLRGVILDETQRHEMEQTLRDEAYRFNAVTGATQDIVFDWDLICDTLWTNRRYQELYGRDFESDAVQNVWAESIHEQDRVRVVTQFQNLLNGDGTKWDSEYRIYDVQNRVRSIHERGILQRDQVGKPIRFIGVATDVTEVVQRESDLRSNRRFLQSTIDGLGAEIAVIDHKANILLTNWSWTAGGRPARSLSTRLKGRDAHNHVIDAYSELQSFLNSSASTFRLEQPIWDPEHGRWFQIRASAFGVADQRKVVLSREDVSAIQAAQQDLARNQARYRAIVEHQDEFVVRYSPDMQITFANASYMKLRNLDQYPAPGTTLEDVLSHRATERSKDRLVAQAKKVIKNLQTKEDVVKADTLTELEDGTKLWIGWSHQAIRDDSGKLTEIQSVGRDITERYIAEEELRRSNDLQSLLLSELNHRVKNTLGGLISLIAAQVNSTNDVSEFADKLTERLRSILSIHSMLSEAKWSQLNMNSIIDSLVPLHLAHRMELTGPAAAVRGDLATPLGMVLQELISNAMKHGAWATDVGTVHIEWDAPNSEGMTRIVWSERGGPEVTEPEKFNLGTKLIKGFTEFELRGHVEYGFNPSGVEHVFHFKLDTFSPQPESVQEAQSTSMI